MGLVAPYLGSGLGDGFCSPATGEGSGFPGDGLISLGEGGTGDFVSATGVGAIGFFSAIAGEEGSGAPAGVFFSLSG